MKLTSLYESNSDLSLEEAVKIFHDECKPFQKEIGFDGTFDFKPLKRGMKNKPSLLIGNVRPDRKPTDTPLPIHEFMDNWFYEKFGVRFTDQMQCLQLNHKVHDFMEMCILYFQ